MKANELFYIDIEELGLSQIYLNQDKLQSIMSWYDPLKIKEYIPLPVRVFRDNGKYTLTDGHTRAYFLYKNGVKQIPVRIDEDEIVTCNLGRKLYQEYIGWCDRFSINNIKDLEHRIVSDTDYKYLWIERCDRLYQLITALEDKTINHNEYDERKKSGESRGLLLYGASNDLSAFYYEDMAGNRWICRDREFMKES